eukprot:c18351_g1_i1.p1 GENE.c18351_g1_i1~~c18351_g1_i1.p1  ORF type:complete len:429 (+),score=70.64 c18351_g1_i1:364-1650(+)
MANIYDVVQTHQSELMATHPASCRVEIDNGRIILFVTDLDASLAVNVPKYFHTYPVVAGNAQSAEEPTKSFGVHDYFTDTEIKAALATVRKHSDNLFANYPTMLGLTLGLRRSQGFVHFDELCIKALCCNDPTSKQPPEMKIGSLVVDFVEIDEHLTQLVSDTPVFVPELRGTVEYQDCERRGNGFGICLADVSPNSDKLQRTDWGTIACISSCIDDGKRVLGFVTAGHTVLREGNSVFPCNHRTSYSNPLVAAEFQVGTVAKLQLNNGGRSHVHIVEDYAFVRSTSVQMPAKIGEDIEWEHLGHTRVTLTGEINDNIVVGQLVFKRGVATGLTPGLVSSNEIIDSHNKRRLLVKPYSQNWGHFAESGDSGSLVFDENGSMVGMVVLMEKDEPCVTVVIPWKEVHESLGLISIARARLEDFADDHGYE